MTARSRLRGGRRGTLRTRVTALAGLSITVAVALGVLAMYALQMQSVRSTVDDQLRTYATQIVQSSNAGTLPRVLAPSTLDPTAEAQVLATDGTVLAATATLAGLPAIYQLPAGATAPVRQKAADGVVPTAIRVIAVRLQVGGRPVTVITGTDLDLLNHVRAAFARNLLLGLPVILVLASGAVWTVVGRTLRPVEEIRRAVTSITSANLSRRVPEPATSDEVSRLARTMNDMLGRLDRAAQQQRRFVADASHELRSPLAALRTTLEVGLAHPTRAPWSVIAARAAEQTLRLEDLIEQLLLLAKADEGLLARKQQEIDLAALLAGLRDSTGTGSRVRLALHTDPSSTVLGDPGDIERLFRNVLDNALRYAGSTVVVRACNSGDNVVVTITDDGPGIAPIDRERVFDRFVRLDSSRGRGTGTSGLGLAIARDVAVAHHGAVEITDPEGAGTCVRITLPRVDPEATRVQQTPRGPAGA